MDIIIQITVLYVAVQAPYLCKKQSTGDGTVIEVNEALVENPRLVNEDPMNNWIIKVEMSDPSELESLLTPEAYEKVCEAEKH